MKKAFTLVELLGVIIILGVLALITFPIIDKSIKNSKEKALERAIDNIEEAAYNYSITNDIGYESFYKKLSLEELKKAGFLEKETINPVTNENMTGCVLYKWDESKKQYEFKYDEECDIQTIADVLLANYPFLATNGNGCVTPTANNYSYMGGCYLKIGDKTGKEFFYYFMSNIGNLNNDEITNTFFDVDGNFKPEEFESRYRNFAIQHGLTEEEIDQMLQESGKNTLFEMEFMITQEDMFAVKKINNYIWYSGFLWRIMGINADGTVKMITDENVTDIFWGKNRNWDESFVREWLNDYFYPRLKGNNIIMDQTWCSEATNNEDTTRTTCTNNLSKEKSKVGLITLDEFNLAKLSPVLMSYLKTYLNIEQYSLTMTQYVDRGASWMIAMIALDPYGSPEQPDITIGVRPVINVNSNATITSGDGALQQIWSDESGPYILNEEKNVDSTGKLNDKAISGEYVMFAGKKYRVVDKDSNGNTKLILDGYYEENGKIFEMEYGDDNEFSTTTGIGQKLNSDVLNWITNNNDNEKNKLVIDYAWYSNSLDFENSYKVALEENDTIQKANATVGLIRVGEMLSSQSSSILTKGYTTTTSRYNNTRDYWTITPYISSPYEWYRSHIGYGSGRVDATYLSSIRPVIVIKSDVTIIGGCGTWSNPYQI